MKYANAMKENYEFFLATLKDALANMPHKTEVPASDLLAVAACALAHRDWSSSEFRMVIIKEMINQAIAEGRSSLVEKHFTDELGTDADWTKVL